MMKRLTILLFAVLIVAGCSLNNDSKSPVLAKVNGKAITKDDFLMEFNRLPEWARERFTTEEGKKKLLEELTKKELIYQDAKRNGLHRDTEYKEKVNEFKKITLIKMALEREVEQKAKVSPEDVKEFYEKNPDSFIIGQQIRASHILVETKEEAEGLYEKIKKGSSFEELAKKFSKDRGSASKGGDLGFFSRGKMVPEFEQVAFRLKKGEVSEPVRTRFGYHIIKVTDIKKGKKGSFEEVKESLARRLRIQRQKELFEKYIERLKGSAEVETAPYEMELKALTLAKEKTTTKE
jgi:peptidyl-prolyl cis-trans isomerase C